MGYYNTAFFSSSSCAGTPIFVEGYATGRCLVLANGGSVRFDCVGSGYSDGVNYPGVQVEIFAASTACTGAVTYSVYPVGSCVTVASGYFTSGNLAATLGAQSFQPLCTFANAAQPSIPVVPDFQKTAIVESVYQSQGCKANAIFQLPDVFKAYVQATNPFSSPLSNCGSVTRAAGSKPYNVGKLTCPNGVQFAFNSNFDGACSYDVTTSLDAVVSSAGLIKAGTCYGSFDRNRTIVGRIAVQPVTIPALSLPTLYRPGCLKTCYKIYPRCQRPSGQPTSQPSMQPSSHPSTTTPKPSFKPTVATPAPTSPTSQPTIQPTQQPTAQPTSNPTRQPTHEPSSQPTRQPTQQPTSQPTRQPTSQPSVQPSSQPSGQPSRQPTSHPSRQPTQQPTRQPTCQPTGQPSRQPTSQPTRQPSSHPTMQPSTQPSQQPTAQPTQQPTQHPTTQPTQQPTQQPTTYPTNKNPTPEPTVAPTTAAPSTAAPSAGPTTSAPSLHMPSSQPTQQPTQQPTNLPTFPSGQPSGQPSRQPTSQPTIQPTQQPTSQPTRQPTQQPTARPTRQPTQQPTMQPTRQPTTQPTVQPTRQPTQQPTMRPTGQPSMQPTQQPTQQPTTQPTSNPTANPTTLLRSSSNFQGCNSTAFRLCQQCQVGPPAFVLKENYKQYSCIGQTIIKPSYAPTTSPNVPSAAPVPAVTFAPVASSTTTGTSPLAVVSGKQAITVSDPTLLKTGSPFESKTCSLTLASAGYSVSDIGTKVTSFSCGFDQSSISSRRQLVAVGNLLFLLQVISANPTLLQAALAGNSAALQSALANAGYTVAVAPAAVANTSPTSAPVSSPSSPSSSCFAGTELVAVETGGHKAIADVLLGDRVLAVNKRGQLVYSDVVYIPHGTNTEYADFVRLVTESGRDVKMTADHLLPAGACSFAGPSPFPAAVAASAVSVGDCVFTVAGPERVASVETVGGRGVYTIVAIEELLVVNGVVATPYGGVNPTLANVYYNLHRLAYVACGAKDGSGWVRWAQQATTAVWSVLTALAPAVRGSTSA